MPNSTSPRSQPGSRPCSKTSVQPSGLAGSGSTSPALARVYNGMRGLRRQSVSQRSGSAAAALVSGLITGLITGSPLGGTAVDVDQRAGDAATDVAGQQGGHGGHLLDRVQPLDSGLPRVIFQELLVGDAGARGRLRAELAHGVGL